MNIIFEPTVLESLVRRSDGESVSAKYMQQTTKHALKRYSGVGFHNMALVRWYLMME
jgi:hypothetical protein